MGSALVGRAGSVNQRADPRVRGRGLLGPTRSPQPLFRSSGRTDAWPAHPRLPVPQQHTPLRLLQLFCRTCRFGNRLKTGIFLLGDGDCRTLYSLSPPSGGRCEGPALSFPRPRGPEPARVRVRVRVRVPPPPLPAATPWGGEPRPPPSRRRGAPGRSASAPWWRRRGTANPRAREERGCGGQTRGAGALGVSAGSAGRAAAGRGWFARSRQPVSPPAVKSVARCLVHTSLL